MLESTFMDHLFEFVKNLDKGEKAFFTKYSKIFSVDKNPIYLQIFKMLDKQVELDEDKIIRKLKIKNYAYHKHYLYEQLLSATKTFHDKESEKKMIIHYTEIADMLMRKRLLGQAEKMVEKAEKLARKNMDGALFIRICQLKIELLKAPKKIDGLGAKGDELLAFGIECAALFKNQLTLNNLIVQMLAIIREGLPNTSTKGLELMRRILQHELIQDETKCVSFYDKTNRLIVLNIIYSWLNEHEKSYETKKEHLRLYEENDYVIKVSPLNYVTPLVNIINGAIQLGKIGEAIIFIKKFDKFKDTLKSKSQILNVTNSNIVMAKLKLLASAPKQEIPKDIFTTALDTLGVLKNKSYRDSNIAFCHYYLAQYYFGIANYNKCLIAVRDYNILETDNKKYVYYRLLSNFFETICLIENESFSTAESVLNSLFKKRKKSEHFKPFLLDLLDYLRGCLAITKKSKAPLVAIKREDLMMEERPLFDWWEARKAKS